MIQIFVIVYLQIQLLLKQAFVIKILDSAKPFCAPPAECDMAQQFSKFSLQWRHYPLISKVGT